MKYLLTSDIHGNLPAAELAVELGRKQAVDRHIHLGDLITIGPWSIETLDYYLSEGVTLLMGNHEEDFILGQQPGIEIGEGEQQHFEWLNSMLTETHRTHLRKCAYRELLEEQVVLQHFVIAEDIGRISLKRYPLHEVNLKEIFQTKDEQMLIFGHIHSAFERKIEETTFMATGPSGLQMKDGCGRQALILEIDGRRIEIQEHQLDWDRDMVVRELYARNIPDAEEIEELFLNR
jgi:predicted phosphodiesterase